MKIMQVVPYFYPAWEYGGPAKVVYDTSQYYLTKGHQVTVYTSDAYKVDQRMPSALMVKNTKNLRVYYCRNIINKFAYKYNIFITPGIIIPSFNEISKFDIIHLHDFYTIQNIWITWLARLFNKPYIISVHGCLEEKRLKQRSLFKGLYLSLFGNKLLLNAKKLIATSDNETESYRSCHIPMAKIVNIGHGVDTKEFATTFSKETCRKKLGLSLNKIVITYLGRIHKVKGLDMLIKTIAIINNEKLHFVIAGSDDGYLPTVKKLISEYGLQEKITLMGTCFGENKAQLFKATDIFIYPSYSEGFSLGILEAAAAGLPLIITTGCHFNQIKDHHAGIIVEPNEKSIATAVNELSGSELKRKIAGNNSLKLVRQFYSVKAIGDRLLQTYYDCINKQIS